MSSAAPDFQHLIRLSDDTGLFEHARHAVVRRHHGYCTDDVARGLVIVSREPLPSQRLTRLAERYLAFLTHAQDHSGAFRNRLGFDRRWRDRPGVGDWWGRAMWGLGTAAARNSAPWIREEALLAFTLGAQQRSPHLRAMTFAGLGAAEVLRADPDSTVAAALLTDAAEAIGVPPENPSWPWPQPYLSYANAALAEVLIAAGDLSDDQQMLTSGLHMLTWLRDIQTRNGRFSVVPAAGWRQDKQRTRYDQQPIEVAALADACAVAFLVTGELSWQDGVRRAAAWFQGANDADALMWDPATSGGYDGLTEHGPNLNQGAESTMALISTMQHARRLS
ncbi:glycosyl transferase [Acrocarpospora macrocephala]|uniref:Glycosyl transferase n=1 Tax=Acrocarpospora macrocephala TaxID=150177 RepID=A0A5M3WGN7_9ACTN|nr:glycosyltransferase [Acrocarpospora macrocephala]GES08287.1 glycosyl transferase [Acrocarpospora macrocephala]